MGTMGWKPCRKGLLAIFLPSVLPPLTVASLCAHDPRSLWENSLGVHLPGRLRVALNSTRKETSPLAQGSTTSKGDLCQQPCGTRLPFRLFPVLVHHGTCGLRGLANAYKPTGCGIQEAHGTGCSVVCQWTQKGSVYGTHFVSKSRPGSLSLPITIRKSKASLAIITQ